jgi:hypothetical protein
MSSNSESGNNASVDEEKKEAVVRAVYFHEDNLFHARFNYFLLAQSLFVAAFASTWRAENARLLGLTLIGAGISTAIIFFWILYKLRKGLLRLRNQYKEVDIYEVYEGYDKATDNDSSNGGSESCCPNVFSISCLLSHWIPILFIFIWCGLLCASANK